ncbi:hypothetical protein NEIRO03_0612 [Nematocida sp. AWRm78]|nr:hypothetical protein NEIRO02_0523 [Nematocida sp. AWRm79]KAI5182977.1 hypothetical protein NEIRO03_0612 [Nematocida sp. AWRm78]
MNMYNKVYVYNEYTTVRNILNISIIIILYINSICTQITLKQAECIQKLELDNNLVINSQGSLSPFYQYIIGKSEYLKMNISKYLYNIKNNKNIREVYSIHEGIYNNYIHNENIQLIMNMYPSEHGYLSIESDSYDSLSCFLREYKNSEGIMYVLASLFLLAEGINIPIGVINNLNGIENNSWIILKKKWKDNEFHVNLNMLIWNKADRTNTDLIYQNRTEYIINFFKNLIKPDESSEVPEEFLNSNLLNNPRFLIQTYLFEYIDSINMYQDFVMCVYNLLIEQVPNINNIIPCTETEKHIKTVFNKLFIDKELNESIENQEYIKYLKLAEYELNNEIMPIPYIKKVTEFPNNNTVINNNPKGIKIIYTNQIKSILLDIFLMFTFNTKTMLYDTSHLPTPSKDLKKFFNKYTNPLQPMDNNIRNEWNNIIENISTQSDYYQVNDDHIIDFQIFSMLYAIRILAGSTRPLDYAIKLKTKDMLKNNNKDNKDNKGSSTSSNKDSSAKDIRTLIQNGFKLLSKEKNIKIGYKNIYEKEENSKKNIRISTNLYIIYKKTNDSDSPTIKIEIITKSLYNVNIKYTISHNKLNNINSNSKIILQNIQEKYKTPKTNIEYIMRVYADTHMDKLSYIFNINNSYTNTN